MVTKKKKSFNVVIGNTDQKLDSFSDVLAAVLAAFPLALAEDQGVAVDGAQHPHARYAQIEPRGGNVDGGREFVVFLSDYVLEELE